MNLFLHAQIIIKQTSNQHL